MEYKKLYRSRVDKVFGGVCSGLGEFFMIDPVILRIIFVILVFIGGGGLLLYILLWIFIPYKPYVNTPSNSQNEPPNQSYQFTETATVDDNSSNVKTQTQVKTNKGSLIAGSILVLLGIFLIIDKYIIEFNFIDLWPFLLIILGVFILFSNNNHK